MEKDVLSEIVVDGWRFIGFIVLLLDGEYRFRLLGRYAADGRLERLYGFGVVAPAEIEKGRTISPDERWKIPFVESYWQGWEFDVLAGRETQDNGSVR